MNTVVNTVELRDFLRVMMMMPEKGSLRGQCLVANVGLCSG